MRPTWTEPYKAQPNFQPLIFTSPPSLISAGPPSLNLPQMASRNQNTSAPSKIVALPSLSCSLSSLPQAKNMNNVSLHPTMYAQRAAESEAKVRHLCGVLRLILANFSVQLQKALSKTPSSFTPQTPTYPNPVRLPLTYS